MIISKHFTVKVTGAWQSYAFSQGLEVNTENESDMKELSSIVGDLNNFGDTISAVSYACQKLVYDEITNLISSDNDFRTVWNVRYQELRNKEQQLNIEMG